MNALAIAIGELEVMAVVGLLTVMLTAANLRQTHRTNYVDELENWVKELRAQNVGFEEKNKAQDAAIRKLEEAVDNCERIRQRESNDHQLELFRLWTEINRLKGEPR